MVVPHDHLPYCNVCTLSITEIHFRDHRLTLYCFTFIIVPTMKFVVFKKWLSFAISISIHNLLRPLRFQLSNISIMTQTLASLLIYGMLATRKLPLTVMPFKEKYHILHHEMSWAIWVSRDCGWPMRFPTLNYIRTCFIVCTDTMCAYVSAYICMCTFFSLKHIL